MVFLYQKYQYWMHWSGSFDIFYSNSVCFMVICHTLWLFVIFCCHLLHFVVFLVYLVVFWYILWSFGTFCGHLLHFVVFWDIVWQFSYILWSFGIFVVIWYFFVFLYQDKSVNPDLGTSAGRQIGGLLYFFKFLHMYVSCVLLYYT
jgi:hypothetical protein